MITQPTRQPLHRRILRRTGPQSPQPVGFVLVMVAASLTALMGFAALGIDLAYLMEAQTELAATADATALAGASGLNASVQEQGKKQAATDRAITYAGLNKVLGQPFDLNKQKQPLHFGRWDPATKTFKEGSVPSNAVHVSLQLTNTSNPSMPTLFFAPVIGHVTGRIAANATAAVIGSSDMVLALDHSGSMGEDTVGNGPQQPLTDTKKAAVNFVNLLSQSENGQVGVIWWNDRVTLQQKLTSDFQSAKNNVNSRSVTPGGYTNIAVALCTARKQITQFGRSGAVEVIVLLTDGKANTALTSDFSQTCNPGPPNGPNNKGDPKANSHATQQAQMIAQQGIVLYTISLGNDTDENFLQTLTPTGNHFKAPTANDLDGIFTQIAAKLPVALVE